VSLALLLGAAGTATATPIINNFGLAAPDYTITFDESVFPQGTVVNNQYAAYGATFSDMVYDTQGASAFPGITGHYLGNFTPIVNPFSISFVSPQNAAAFGMATNPATTTITALYLGAVVESFVVATSFDNPAQGFYGFSGIVFDEIQVDVVGDELALIDNVQVGQAVPEPGTMLLLGGGLLGLLARRRAS
jgi:hypothetical protein